MFLNSYFRNPTIYTTLDDYVIRHSDTRDTYCTFLEFADFVEYFIWNCRKEKMDNNQHSCENCGDCFYGEKHVTAVSCSIRCELSNRWYKEWRDDHPDWCPLLILDETEHYRCSSCIYDPPSSGDGKPCSICGFDVDCYVHK